MKIEKTDGGLWIPKQKEKPKKRERPTKWDCPKCGEPYDTTKQFSEEATVGSLREDAIPHITCPACNKCMGCRK